MDQFNAVSFVFENSVCFFTIYEREGSHVLGVEKLTQTRENWQLLPSSSTLVASLIDDGN